ncbi:MAG: response regulator [Pseudomonadota bacterium]
MAAGNKGGKALSDERLNTMEDSEEKTLQWLLDRDMEEPEEKLFSVEEELTFEIDLTDQEAEMASRPMFGETGGDGLGSFVAEDIVMELDGGHSDIFDVAEPTEEAPKAAPLMAIEARHGLRSDDSTSITGVSNDQDILCLSDEDDIGEKHVTIKRATTAPSQAAAPTPPSPSIATTTATTTASEELPSAHVESKSDASLSDYLSNQPAPVDEEAFDRYLLAGKDLADTPANVDDLEIVLTEGVASVDPSVAADIDYHEDFAKLDSIGGSAVSLIALVLAETMEALQRLVNERLTEFGVDTSEVSVDVMLGADPDAVAESVRAGYAPVRQVCPDLPAPLQKLDEEQVDAIYVSLFHRPSSTNWNGLLGEHFLPSPTEAIAPADEAFGEVVEAASGDAASEATERDVELASVFDDDIFDIDLEAELNALPAAEDDDLDLDAMINTLSAPDDTLDGELDLLADVTAERKQIAGGTDRPVAEAPDAEAVDDGWYLPEGIEFNYSSASASASATEIFAEFLDSFIEEAASELEKLENVISQWSRDPDVPEIFAPVPRTLHNLKGIAKGVGLQYYGTLIHNFETLLEGMGQPDPEDCSQYFRIVDVWLDAALRGFDYIQDNRGDIASELPRPGVKETGVEARTAEPETTAADEPESVVSDAQPEKAMVDQEEDRQLADEGAKTLTAQQTIRLSAESVDHLLNLTNQSQQLGVRASQSTIRSKRATSELLARLSSVRSHIAKIADKALMTVRAQGDHTRSHLDALEMDQYSELQEAANILREGVEDLDDLIHHVSRQSTVAEALLKQQASVISSLNASIQTARVVPVSRLMPGLRRIVRTLSHDLDKQVAFRALNEVGSLDRDNFNRCQIILEHMVRNAMDHGIEAADERLAAGKPTSGHITVDVKKEGSDYVITLTDDGRGMDPEALRERAYELGLHPDTDSLSDDEALRLIFHKGFSTARKVSEVSGRGVGMEIVMDELQSIGGEIQIQSERGKGTAFSIRIPSNVTVNGALMVSAGAASYAIPMDGLVAVEHIPVTEFLAAMDRGQTVELVGLNCEPAYLATLCSGEGLPDPGLWGQTVPVLIAGSESRYMAIAVDDVQQALELVIRSLGNQFNNVAGVAGATTTSEGEALVALDLNALVRSYGYDHLESNTVTRDEQSDHLMVLVVDDSRTQRLVATSQLDALGVETVTAENGMVAIDLLNTTHRLPDVILLDIEMPVKDGIQTLKEIRNSLRYRHIPVIMVTSRTGAKHRAMAEQAGCNGYMGKPFNFPLLVEQIAEFTGFDLKVE